MKIGVTSRGFRRADFVDHYNEECSIQESSLATDYALWLGVDSAVPKVLVRGRGWLPVPLPEGASSVARMHLTQEQVVELLPLLQHFVDTGRLPQE